MQLTELIEIVSWSLWIIAGIVIGLIAAYLGGVRGMIIYDVIVGVIASVLGGFCSALWGGDMTKSQLIVSVLVACFTSGCGVLILNRLCKIR